MNKKLLVLNKKNMSLAMVKAGLAPAIHPHHNPCYIPGRGCPGTISTPSSQKATLSELQHQQKIVSNPRLSTREAYLNQMRSMGDDDDESLFLNQACVQHMTKNNRDLTHSEISEYCSNYMLRL